MVAKLSSFFQRVLIIRGAFYIFTTVFVLFWMLFFDSNDFISQYHRSQTLKELEDQEAFYLENIKKVETDKNMMSKDVSTQEKYAREVYRMKRPSEEVYIIKHKD